MQQCVICILDILGTKGIWTEESLDKYFDVIKNVEDDLNKAKVYFIKAADNKPLEFEFITFSDTLILTIITKNENHEYFFEEVIGGFTQFILGVFQSYFAERFFVRGAISFGMIEKRGSHFIGPAVDDAAEYFEQMDMIGICLTPKTSIAMEYALDWNKRFFQKQVDLHIIKYKTPLKNKNKTDLFLINWPKFFITSAKESEQNPLGHLGIFMGKRNIPLNAISKFDNTLDFFNYVLQSSSDSTSTK